MDNLLFYTNIISYIAHCLGEICNNEGKNVVDHAEV